MSAQIIRLADRRARRAMPSLEDLATLTDHVEEELVSAREKFVRTKRGSEAHAQALLEMMTHRFALVGLHAARAQVTKASAES